MPDKTYTPSDGFYEDLASLLGSLTCYLFTVDSLKFNKISTVHSNPTFPLEISSITEGRNYVLRPHTLLKAVAADTVPSSIVLHAGSAGLAPPTHILASTSHMRLISQIIEGAFLRYYENQKDSVSAKYGNVSSWPGVWNFGRVVRNAFGHGGKISFSNQNSLSVIWNGVQYGPVDNGRQVLFNDLAICDIIFLMEDMDTAL